MRTRGDRLADGGRRPSPRPSNELPAGVVSGHGAKSPGRSTGSDIGNPLSTSADSDGPGQKKRYPEMTVTVIEARERQMPTDRDRIDWKLITNLAVNSRRQAVEKGAMVRTALEDRGLS